MVEEVKRREPFDEYADQFTVSFNSFGANLSFAVSDPHSPETGQTRQSRRLGTIRMTVEDIKTMAFVLWYQIHRIEQNTGVVEVSGEVLDEFQVPRNDWDALWKLK